MHFFHIINGERRISAQTLRGMNPRTDDLLWEAPLATVQDLDDAVAAAREASTSWSKSAADERIQALRRIIHVLQENRELLMEIIMKETGKSRLLAGIEVDNSCRQTAFYTENTLSDEVTFEDDTLKIISTHVPLGVVGAICPWNFPLILSNIKVISSLITGNCVILKPSPLAPYAVLKSVELCAEVLPPGVLQVINGEQDIGAALTLHPGIDKISFTGTIATGKLVMANCAKTLKRLTLELAGNDAAVVCDDVDISKVAAQVASGCFFNAGQMCVATKRVYVHESIFDEFLEAFVAEVNKSYTKNLDPLTPSVFGPLSNRLQADVVEQLIKDCEANGYNIVAGKSPFKGSGLWVSPTVVSKPPENSKLVKEEQFGPIVPVLSWQDEGDVIRRANLSNAGLGASVYSRHLARAERIARSLEAGSVWINMPEMPNPCAFFAGQKESGHGGEMGRQGLLSYCYTQSLHLAKA